MRSSRRAVAAEEVQSGGTSLYDARLYREKFNSGDYIGIIERPDKSSISKKRFRHPDDAAVVLQKLHDELDKLDISGSKGGLGSIAVQPNKYTFKSTFEISERGFGLYGLSTFQQGRSNSGPQFSDGGVGTETPMILAKDTKGTVFNGIYLNLRGNESYGIQIENTDACHIRNVNTINQMGSRGRGIRGLGSYETIMENCFIHQMELSEGVKNINNWRIANCNFRTANSDQPVLELVNGGNDFFNCTINTDIDPSGGLNDGVPAVTSGTGSSAGFIRYTFTLCRTIGSGGDPLFDHSGSLEFNFCSLGGAKGPIFNTMYQVKVQNCSLGPSDAVVRNDNGNRNLHKGKFVNNIVTGANNSGGDAAIDLKGEENNSNFLIANNIFRGGNGTYDIKFTSKNAFGSGVVIKNNIVQNGITTGDWGIGAIRGENTPPAVIENIGYNDVGTDRSTPSLPSGTGSSNGTSNSHPQPVKVYMSGGAKPYDPTIIDENGSSFDVPGSPNQVEVPRFGGIYFRSNVPNEWRWYWK